MLSAAVLHVETGQRKQSGQDASEKLAGKPIHALFQRRVFALQSLMILFEFGKLTFDV